MLNKFLPELFAGKFDKALSILDDIASDSSVPIEVLTMLRLAIFKPDQNSSTGLSNLEQNILLKVDE